MSNKQVDFEKVVDKVKKLLSLSKNNPNSNEAQTALLKAQKLMAENGVEVTDVEII